MKKHKSNTMTVTGDTARVESPVTVVVPAYGVERYIEECMRSVMSQTFKDWRMVVVVDGSPDRTLEIAEKVAREDSRITVAWSENRGVSAARNLGLEYVETPYILFLDADDILHPEILQRLLWMQEGRTDRISCIDQIRFAESGELPWMSASSSSKGDKWNRDKIKRLSSREAIREIFYQGEVDNSPCGKLFPRGCIPSGIFREGIIYEDLDAFYHIFENVNEIVLQHVALYGYRQNPESLTQVFNERRADVLDVAERLERHMAANDPALLPAARSRLLSAYFNMHGLSLCDPVRYSELRRRCMSGIRRLRRYALTDRNVRPRNKIAALASYIGGEPLLTLLERIFYKI